MFEKIDFRNILLACMFFFIAPHMLILFIAFLKCLKKNRSLLIVCVALMVVVAFVYPDYLRVPISDFCLIVDDLRTKESSVMVFLFTSAFQYSLIGNLFLAHITLILALAVKELGRHYEITNLNHNLKELERSENTMKTISHTDLENRTVIGSCGKRLVSMSDFARHVFICGTTGSGKTVALSNYIESAIKKDYPLLIVDGKGDIGENSIADIVNRFRGNRKLYVVDMNQPTKSAKYNPFYEASPSVVKDMLINLTTWSEEHYKANAERYIQRIIWLTDKMGIVASFQTLISYMNPDKLLELATLCYKAGKISKDEFKQTGDIIKVGAEITQGASARFITIFESDIGTIFANSDNKGIDIYKALEENAIILFVLSPLLYPETSIVLGKLIMIDAKKAVSKLFGHNEKRVFYIFDEISTYASPLLIDLINKSRSAGVTTILATQSLSDLDFTAGEAFKEQLIENCNNYIVMRQNSAKNAEAWSKILGTVEGLAVTYQIGEKSASMVSTGLGSVRKERHFLYHPDDIKRLTTGEEVYMSKDENVHYKIKIRKGF